MLTYFRKSILLLALLSFAAARSVQAAPEVINITPTPGSTVVQLPFINVIFNEAVLGVNNADLLINGFASTRVTTNNPNDYTFYFPVPPTGTVLVAWSSSHGITDTALVPFVGTNWTYTLDPNSAPPPNVVISEFLADNGNGIQDENGTRADWIELLNRGSLEANIGGWFISDDRLNLTKWKFPAGMPPIAVNGYLRIWASEKNRTNPLAPLHLNFRLSKNAGSFLALSDARTNIVSSFNPYPEQFEDISYGRDRVDPELVGYFNTPTPGAHNTVGGSGFAPDPVFSHETGIYTNASITLTISAPAGASIRYTRDGTVPTTNSTLYSGPVSFTNNSTFKARVFQSGVFPSRVVGRNFIFLDGSAADFNSNLPLLIISTEGRGMSENVPPGGARTRGAFALIDTFRGRSSIRATPDVYGFLDIEVAGQTSAGFAKRPYRFEIQDELLQDRDVSLLGMPADSDWRLRNPINDKTMLNDFMAFELFEKMGHYSVRRKFVEVFVDTGGGRLTYPGDYVGVEVLCENIKVNNDRVNVPEITPFATNEPAITGGYIFKKDKVSVGDLDFATPGSSALGFVGQALKLHEPKPNFLRTAQGVTTSWPGPGYTAAGTNQMRYLSNYLARMEGALYAPNWLSLTGTNHYSHYLDVDSFVDTHWVVEFPKQIDGYRLSGFFTKDRDGKVVSGPIWDWNLAYGNADYLEGGYTNGWYFAVQSQGMTANEHIWLRRLINGNAAMGANNTLGPGGDADFNQKIADRWSVLRTNICGLSNTLARIDELSTLLSEAAARDLWGKYRASVVGIGNWPNPGGTVDHNGTPPGNDANPGRPWDVDFFHPTNYLGSDSNSIIWQMKKWVTGRFNWIDAQFTPIPTLSAVDGMVSNGFTVTISGPPGVAIYYTLDGSDPRGFQGVTNGIRYTGPITVNGNTRVVARARGSSQFYNTWSGPAAVTLYTSTPALRITEIMYHPPPPPAGSTNADEDFEYIEVRNTGGTALNVNRFSLAGGVQFIFPNVVLQPGEYAVVVKDIAAFQSRYGTSINVLGSFTGNLDNAGENIVLLGGVQEPILDFSYDDDWYPTTDGLGFALNIVDENAARDTWGLASSWRAGSAINGSPGQADPAVPSRPTIVVSEALTHTDPPAVDTIELHNSTGTPVDIGGWFLSDEFDTPKKYIIPAATIIPAGGYVVFNETDHFGASFGLSSLGDDVWLFSGDGVNLTGYSHGFDFGPAANGVSFGRHIISTGADHFVAQAANTPGAANAGPLVGPVVVTEINYTPWDVTVGGAGYNNTEDEFVELYNSSSNPVPLYDVSYPTNTWRLRDAVDFAFPTGVSIPGQGTLLVASFDPSNAAALAAFRARNGVPASVPVYGPFSGRLDNEGDSVELVRPDVPQPPISENPGFVPYILVERIRYSSTAPWPLNTNGLGFSLQRVNVSAYGNDPANWALGGSSAGSQYSGGTAPAITGQPANTNVVAYYGQATMRVTANGTGPLRYQWRFGSLNINDGTNATLLLSNVQPSDEGLYSVIVFNQAGYVTSSSAFLDVLIPAAITAQPTNLPVYVASTNIANYGQNARVASNPAISNATFRITAVSERAMSFQWYHDDVLIPGANGNVYTIDNITLDHNGEYYCVVTDAISYVPSQRARLNVAVVPFVSSPYPEFQTNRHPQPITALVGEDVTFGVVHGGTPPFGYRWRLNSQPLTATNGGYIYFPFFTVNNVQTSATVRTYSVVITNLGNQAPGLLTPPGGSAVPAATLTVLADTDGDGAPDTWETQFGFNPASGADGSQDFDGDGASNAAEWRAGTDPTNPSSYLKVDSISVAGSTVLSFVALAGKSYQIEVRDSLNPGPWNPLTFVPAASTNRTVSLLDTNAASRRYYRLATPLQQD